MGDFLTDKKTKKQMDREATVKHYILGFILECAYKTNVEEIFHIRRFLVSNLKIISEETFVNVLHELRSDMLLGVNLDKAYYRRMRFSIKVIPKTEKELADVTKKFYQFAKGYKNGKYISTNMSQTSYDKN